MKVIIVVAAGGVAMLCFVAFVSLNERRLAVRTQPSERAAKERHATWRATRDPDDCPHDDVLEDWSERLDTWYGGIQPSVPKILDQGGVCRQCGARVVRHGSPLAWSEWMIDTTDTDDGGDAAE